MFPGHLLSVFPALISSSGGSDLFLKGRDKSSDLSKELWVLRGRSDLRERLDEWLVSGEFVVKVGHVFKSFGDTLDSALELDEQSTSAHGGKEVDSVLTSGDTVSVFLIELSPGIMLQFSLSGTSVDSVDDRFELSSGVIELLFSISEEFLGVFSGAFSSFLGTLVELSLVVILWDESITSGNSLGMSAITALLSLMKLIE
jgi:hypothetical protein